MDGYTALNFDLTGLNSATASLNGTAAADDSVTIKLNGNTGATATGFSLAATPAWSLALSAGLG